MVKKIEKKIEKKIADGSILIPYFRASYPVLFMLSPEEGRIEREILAAAESTDRKNISLWSCTRGLVNLAAMKNGGTIKDKETMNPVTALEKALEDGKTDSVYIFHDLHKQFSNAQVLRLIREISVAFKRGMRHLIITSPVKLIPPEIERDITLIEFELPTKEHLGNVWNKMLEGNKKLKSDTRFDETENDRIAEAALGLTGVEAENAMAKAVIESYSEPEDSRPTVSSIVMREKASTVKKTGILEYFKAEDNSNAIGGLEVLKKWLTIRKNALTIKAREFGLPSPRGYVMVGLPGCGKSLSAKVTANIFGVPLIRFDISRVFAGLVGQSEQNMRTAIQTIEAIGNCVVWIDEMEKAFAGAGSSQSGDSGVTQRVFGNFLSWMQEKTSPCFIVATVNRIGGLPPELLRKGRFDEIFFIDLPDVQEREEILKIHISKRGRDVDVMMKDPAWADCLKESEGFSGAELEEAVVSGLYTAFHLDPVKDLQMMYVQSAILNTTPISKSQEGNLSEMGDWARKNAVLANKRQDKNMSRKLQLD